MRTALAIALVAGSAGTARAAVPRCSETEADLAYAATDFAQHSGDTGWFPQGYSAQLRITGLVTGKTTVAMGLAPKACWDDAGMHVKLPARAQTGLLDSEYGAQVHLYGQIHTSVLGYGIDWSGEIPLHFIPLDLLLAGTTTFDPVALPDSPQPSVSTSDTTSRIVLLSTDLLTEIIAITGISGGLNINVQGQMATRYSTTSITVDGHAITSTNGDAKLAAPAHGFGASLAPKLSAAGVVHYDPALIFGVAFDVKIFGIRVVNWELATVTLPLPTIDREIALASDAIAIPLPHFDNIPTNLGFASGASQVLALHNAGLAPLVIEVASAPVGVTAKGLTIAPGADGTITVTADDPTMLGTLELTTNDPNHPSLAIALEPQATGQTNTTADPDPVGDSTGCSTGRGNALGMLAIVLAFAIRRRR